MMRYLTICVTVILSITPVMVTAQTTDPCAAMPPAGSVSQLYRDGTRLCWNGQPVRLDGYYTTDLATRNEYDYARFLNTIRLVDNDDPNKRHGVNLTRVWAMGTGNYPDCYHTPADHDPRQPPMTMPFALMPGEACTRDHPLPKYNLCLSGIACDQGVGLNPSYQARLQDILRVARSNGILVELVLFDAYYMGKHDADPLYARNPWNPSNNNMNERKFRRFPGDQSFAACSALYQSSGPSDLTDDAFPEFYNICSNTSTTESCDKTLNCMGLIEKAYVQSIVNLVKNNPGGSDNVFFEIMNRSTFDKHDSKKEGFDLAKFKRWNDVVGYWIKCLSGTDCRSTKGDYLVLAEVGIAQYNDLACTDRKQCPVNPLDALAMPNIDIVDFQGYTWRNSDQAPGACTTVQTALRKYKKPVMIDTDSAYERFDKCKVAQWASELKACGNPGEAHLNHLDGMTFGTSQARACGFHGTGAPLTNRQFDEMYLDCHALDTIAAGDPTYLSSIVSTSPPSSCPNSINISGQPVWCSATCK